VEGRLKDRSRYLFFLGGQDLEMATIRRLLEAEAPAQLADKGLAWGARASDYEAEIRAALAAGKTPVLVELEVDLELPRERVLLADHHGPRAGKDRPSALRQVFDLLGLPEERWSRWLELVAANDTAYLAGLERAGATAQEMRRVRAADRAAQGVTEADEAAAEEALSRLERRAGGRLLLARLPHGRTAPLVDRLQPQLGGPGFENLLVLSSGEVNFFGTGDLIEALDHRFPGGWKGGALPEAGYWGHGDPTLAVVAFLESYLAGREAGG
jgi:hypothetical protein